MSRLRTHKAGNGPILVMLHGLFGSLDNFRSVSLHMERTLSVLRIDLPGHGESPSTTELSIKAMADAVLMELGHLGIARFSLLGHSLGGKVAMAMAGNPACTDLEKLCIVDIAPKAYPPHHQQILEALKELDLEALTDRREADTKLRTSIPEAGVRAFLLKGLYRSESKRFRWRFDLNTLSRDYPLICQAPEITQVIEQPTLFIKGSKSDYLTADDETTINTHFAQPSLKVIEGAGHWPHAEKPAQFTRICHDFLMTNESLS